MPHEITVTIRAWDSYDTSDIKDNIERNICSDGYTWSDYHDCWILDNECLEIRGEQRHESECLQCPTCGDMFVEEYGEECCDDTYCCQDCVPEPEINDWHSQKRTIHEANTENPWRIGLEIEKEDIEVKEEIINGLEVCDGWIIERDGSLDEDSGFELISPAFNLSNNKIFDDIDKYEQLINADSSLDCGGHISISHYGLTGEQTLEKMRSLVPLLMSLYKYRLKNRFCCKGTNKKTIISTKNEKHMSFRTESKVGGRVECRIISRVTSVQQLKWRIRLIKYMLESQLSIVDTYKSIKNGKLRDMLLEVYDKDKVAEVAARYLSFSIYFHNGRVANSIKEFIYTLPPQLFPS